MDNHNCDFLITSMKRTKTIFSSPLKSLPATAAVSGLTPEDEAIAPQDADNNMGREQTARKQVCGRGEQHLLNIANAVDLL
ncbi:MAG: hypothetical protein QM784_08490 [Polyangiaceae bacterium]